MKYKYATIFGAAAFCFALALSSCKTDTTKKATGEGEAQPGAAATAPRKDKDEIIANVKKMYICPQINISLADADKKGALCPEGVTLIGLVDKMIAGNMQAQDIYFLVQNYKIQGRSIVEANGRPVCAPADGRVKLEFFIMSYCPFGVRYVDSVLRPMIADLGSSVDWRPYYILGTGPDGKLSSMHGQKEVDEDLRQICIRDKWGIEKWNAYMSCFSAEIFYKEKDPAGPKDWKFCAQKAGVPADSIAACLKNEGPALAKKDMEIAGSYQAGGSPTAVYNCSSNIVGAIPYDQVKPRICEMFPKGKSPATCGG